MLIALHVINLDRSPQRLERVSAHANAAGMPLRRVPAVDGQTIAGADWPDSDIARFRRSQGREPLVGEYAVHRSQLKALETFLAHGEEWGVIAEDDIAFDTDAQARLEALAAAAAEAGLSLFKLVNHRARGFVEFGRTSLGDPFGRCLFGPLGSAAAYLVNRDGAQRLLAGLAEFHQPVDVAIERFWDHGVGIAIVEPGLFRLDLDPEGSLIANGEQYRATKSPRFKRLPAYAGRFGDHVRRIGAALFSRSVVEALWLTDRSFRQSLGENKFGWSRAFFGVIALFLMLSVVWVETDAYRLGAIILAVVAIYGVIYEPERPPMPWIGWLCIAWSAWVAFRIVQTRHGYAVPDWGSAEGIYLLPALYPVAGFALCLLRRYLPAVGLGFAFLSLALLVVSTDYMKLAFGGYYQPLFHNNPIHGSLATAFILMVAIAWLPVAWADRSHWRNLFVAVALGLVVFSVANLVAGRSRGVWLAALAGVAIQVAYAAWRLEPRQRARLGAFVAATLLVVAAAGWSVFAQRLGPLMEFGGKFLGEWQRNGFGLDSFDSLLFDPSYDQSARTRLALWVNGLRIWSENIWIGVGIAWEQMLAASSIHVKWNFFHNGYVEMGVRHGLAGLAFLAVTYGWIVATFHRARRQGVISHAVLAGAISLVAVYLVSLFSNSNNRLALGEAFGILAAAAAFALHFRMSAAPSPSARDRLTPSS